jgi:NAD(P) transhydrogenase subunit beta
VNPAALDEPGSPIHGMPIIRADSAQRVMVMKRSMASGFAGIENDLFYRENTYMIFGDARKTLEGLITEIKQEISAGASKSRRRRTLEGVKRNAPGGETARRVSFYG